MYIKFVTELTYIDQRSPKTKPKMTSGGASRDRQGAKKNEIAFFAPV